MSPSSSLSCSKEVFGLIRSFLSYVNSACRSFLIYHRVVVLPRTVGLLSLLVEDPKLSRWLLIIGWCLSGFPCVKKQEIYSHIGICAMIWIPLVFIIGYEGLFRMLLAYDMSEAHTLLLVCPSSSKLFILAEYLALVNGICPNSFLPVDSIPWTYDHLF